MSKNLAEKGLGLHKPLIIYNRTTQKAHDFAAENGNMEVASSIQDATSRADIIFYCLGDDPSVIETLDEVLKVDIKGKIIVDCSTVHPDTTAKEAKMVEDKGGDFVACPVFGAPAMAEAAQLICVFAGKTEAVQKVLPYGKGIMGRANIDYSGQEASKATLLKIIGNTFVVGMVNALSEGHVVAEKSGLGVDDLHKFIEVMFPGPYTAYSTRMMSGDYYNRPEPLFAVDLARKDARHAMALAEQSGCRMRQVELADSYLKTVKEQKGEKGDIAGIYGAVRVQGGLPYDNQ